MELDHIFITVSKGGPERGAFERLGLRETYRRAHPGQGTANICYAFNNAFVELLWLEDRDEAESPPIQRTRLSERCRLSQTQHVCPFGLAWRHDADISTWDYRPPYLPPDVCIPVAIESDDVRLPMMFRSPGALPPSGWSPERQNDLQSGVGWARIDLLELAGPGFGRSSALAILSEAIGFTVSEQPEYLMRIALLGNGRRRETELPHDLWS